MPKLTHPHTKSFSHAGETYEADEVGLIDFPDDVVGIAIAHGFRHPTAKEREPVDALEKIAALETANADLTMKLADSEASNVQLRNMVADFTAAKSEAEREVEGLKAELAKTKKVKS